MSSKLNDQVEKLIDWRISDLGGTPTVEEIVKSLARGVFNVGQLPEGVTLSALHTFRKRNDASKRQFVARVYQKHQFPVPATAESLPASAPDPESAESLPASAPEDRPSEPSFALSRSAALAELSRQTTLELVEEHGEVYIPLRAFEALIGKRPDNLRRTLESRGFPVVDVLARTERGQRRPTPAILVAYIFAVVGLADIHGMEQEERSHLFALQRNLPKWMRRFDQATAPSLGSSEPRGPFVHALNTVATSITNRIVAALTTGFTTLSQSLNRRFDAVEERIDRFLNGPTPPASSQVRREPRTTRANGSAKISTRPPFRDIQSVTDTINKNLQSLYTPFEIVQFARDEGIYEAALWGVEKAGVDDATVLDGGQRVTWRFDSDSFEVLYEVARRDTVSRNRATR